MLKMKLIGYSFANKILPIIISKFFWWEIKRLVHEIKNYAFFLDNWNQKFKNLPKNVDLWYQSKINVFSFKMIVVSKILMKSLPPPTFSVNCSLWNELNLSRMNLISSVDMQRTILSICVVKRWMKINSSTPISPSPS